jgi:hypothetical protein
MDAADVNRFSEQSVQEGIMTVSRPGQSLMTELGAGSKKRPPSGETREVRG